MGFSGYAPEAISMLREMGSATQTEAASLRPRITAELTEPSRELVETLGSELRQLVSTGLRAVPKVNGSISPFHRDLRFTADRRHPLKDHIQLVFWEGEPKRQAATLRLRITPAEVGFGASVDLRDRIPRWRSLVAVGAGAELADAIDAARSAYPFLGLGDPELRAVPKGFEPDHERAELLRRRSFLLVGATAAPKVLGSPRFVDWCARRLAALGDVHRWLVRHLVDGT